MFANIDQQCGSISQSLPELSFFDTGFSFILFLLTVPCNTLILLGLYKCKPLLSRNYYLIIFNIVVADLITGLICDPLSISFHLKEALGAHIPKIEQTALHYSFFLTNSVAVFSMTVLAVDRLGVILMPFCYYSKAKKPRIILVLCGTWCLAACITLSYFFVGYIRFLIIFACTSIFVTLAFMIVTMILLRRLLVKAKSTHQRPQNGTTTRHRANQITEFTQMDRKVTQTFLCMLLLFIINYLPCLLLTFYMNICSNCDCRFVHVMRDVVVLSILSSALFRALNFVIRLETLQKAIKTMVKSKSSETSETSLKDNPMSIY